MRLCNFSNTSYHLDWYQQEWSNLDYFLKTNGLDGIELLLHGNDDISHIPQGLVKGLHLSYYPTWLDFYKQENYEKDFPTKEKLIDAFGDTNPQCIHDKFIKEFEIAKALNAKYMVFHVGHVSTEHAFNFEYDYSNLDVLNGTLEIVNDVFKGDGPMLLFENLWWPGLTLKNASEIEYFMSKVNYKNKGIMLDLSHLMLTNDTSLDDVTYILETLDQLETTIEWIKGIHINDTNGVSYMKQKHQEKYVAYTQAEQLEKYRLIYEHISSMDQHLPFRDKRLSLILDKIQPDYQMIEVSGGSKALWEGKVIEQVKVLNAL